MYILNFGLVFEKTREKADYRECCYTTTLIQLFSCQLVSHVLKCAYKFYRAQFRFVAVLKFFFSVLGSLCCWRCSYFTNYKHCLLSKKCVLSVCVACMSESPNVLVAIFFIKTRLILKPKNAMKSSESRKKIIADYQAHKTALKVWISPWCVREIAGLFKMP